MINRLQQFSIICALALASLAHAAPPAGTPLVNQAGVTFVDPDTSVTFTQQSGSVTAVVQAPPPPTIDYWRDDTYTATAPVARSGSPVYVQAVAPGCNLNSTAVETNTITIASQLTGDTETFTAIESGPNTGLFRVIPNVPTRDANTNPIVAGNGIMETKANDVLSATIAGCGPGSATATILIDPNGVVFDSVSNLPLAGATVQLFDVTAGTPATVQNPDGSPAPSTVVTGADGTYQFPLVAPSTYRLIITPPGGYTFPSAVPVGSLPAGRTIDASGSYGGDFVVADPAVAVQVDVPLDAAAAPVQLFIEKIADKTEVEIGDSLLYTIKIQNNTTNVAADVTVVDNLPAGFKYLAGTARLGAVVVSEPAGSPGPQLTFSLGNIAASSTISLTYRVSVGPGALQGDGINQARASSGGTGALFSNDARAKVTIRPGPFSDKVIIIGKVFVDTDRNTLQDAGEPGIPGIRIYIEDGTYVITDIEGKYSFYGLSPRSHVLKLDETTLPRGFKASPLTPRHNRSGLTCLADVTRGELRKINFADSSGDTAVLDEVKRRRAAGDVYVAEVLKGLDRTLGSPAPTGDVKAQPAAGVIGAPSLRYEQMIKTDTLNSDNSVLPTAPVLKSPRVDLTQAAGANNELAFLDLRDKDTLPMAQANIRVQGATGAKLVLKVNGATVPDRQVGKRVELKDKQLQAAEYIGIELKPGENQLELTQTDSFGNVRGRKAITIVAPGRLGRIKLLPPPGELPADGVTPITIGVEVTDDRGVPVTARTPVTLEANFARWNVADLNPKEDGIQQFIADGRGQFELLPPQVPGDGKIAVSSGVLQDEATLSFVPDLRPMIASGVIETRINIRKFNISALQPARQDDGFEAELRNWSFTAHDGEITGGARAALFLKGKIKGDYLLTLAYDSEKEANERLFRDIQPDEFYPVYGDSSVRGYDAQSTSRLYVRVDKRKCYALYGDFVTDSQTEARGLGNYNRSLTGVKTHLENNRASVNLWATKDTSSQVIREFPANGTSGPYFFDKFSGLENSEKVELIVRDRNQSSVILKTVPLARFADYEYEPFAGRLLLRAPVPSFDSNLNPISIRVTFEVDQGGADFWTYGVDGQLRLLPRWEVGGSYVRDENPLNNYELGSVNTTVKLADRTFLIGEFAQTESDLRGDGDAYRVELRHSSSLTELRAYYANVDTNFDNSASVITAGREEAGIKIRQRLAERTALIAQGIYTRDLATDGDLKGVVASVEHTFRNLWRAEVGARYSDESVAPATATTLGITPNEVTSVRGKLTIPLPYAPQGSFYGEFENDVEHTDRRTFAIGGDYQTADRTRFYVRHEFLSALGSPFELNSTQERNTTLVGIETAYMRDGTLFNEYRLRDGITGREGEAAIGLRNTWTLDEGVRLHTTFERVSAILSTNLDAEATAATVGLEYTRNPDWKATGRLEFRDAETEDRYLNTLGYALKVDDNWTMLARSILLVTDNQSPAAGDELQARFQIGYAYRPTNSDVWNGLMRYEFKYEDDETLPGAEIERIVNIISAHVNWQATRQMVVSGRYTGKIAHERDLLVDDTSVIHLLSSRISYDLTPRFNVALNLSTMIDGETGAQQYGVGPEVGYLVGDNVWISVGYNLLGFHDEDLSAENYTDHGVFIGMRMQFDEHLFDFARKKK